MVAGDCLHVGGRMVDNLHPIFLYRLCAFCLIIYYYYAVEYEYHGHVNCLRIIQKFSHYMMGNFGLFWI